MRKLQSGAIAVAVAVWLGACVPPDEAGMKPAAKPADPIRVEALSAPIALAPSLSPPPAAAAKSVTPAPPPPPPEKPVVAAVPVKPPTAPAEKPAAAPEPATAATVPAPPNPPVNCPPGTTGMWSPPDAAGVPVFICRRLVPPG